METNKIVNNVIEFMNRVPLKGAEVPAFLESMRWISSHLEMENKKDIIDKESKKD